MGTRISIQRNTESTASVRMTETTSGSTSPTPARMPMAAVIQIDAAVVRPRTFRPSLTMTPAPRKPIPVMIPCAMRVGSSRDSPGVRTQ